MQVKVRYTAQMRDVAARADEVVELEAGGTVSTLVSVLATRFGADGARHLVSADGQLLRSLLVVVNDDALSAGELGTRLLRENDVVTFLPPIAGG